MSLLIECMRQFGPGIDFTETESEDLPEDVESHVSADTLVFQYQVTKFKTWGEGTVPYLVVVRARNGEGTVTLKVSQCASTSLEFCCKTLHAALSPQIDVLIGGSKT